MLTRRDFPDNGMFEYIEAEDVEGKRHLYHRMGETRLIAVEACFPVSVDCVQEQFIASGRVYVPTGTEVAKTVSDLANR